jgi:hypothetical protein
MSFKQLVAGAILGFGVSSSAKRVRQIMSLAEQAARQTSNPNGHSGSGKRACLNNFVVRQLMFKFHQKH